MSKNFVFPWCLRALVANISLLRMGKGFRIGVKNFAILCAFSAIFAVKSLVNFGVFVI